MKYIFHGSNAKLLDDGLVAGTYFTDDLEIALKYGSTIYAIDFDLYQWLFYLTGDGHHVSHNFIPLDYLTVLQLAPTAQKESK